MRNSFINKLFEYFKSTDDFYFLTADLGFSVLEIIRDKFPKNFLNVGICEQNMSLLSVGMSENTNVVYNYSIAPFLTLKSFEIYRNYYNRDNRNIKIIAVGSAFSYGQMGFTHHILEDVAMMSLLENFYICNPSSSKELDYIYKLQKSLQSPFYIRLSKENYFPPKDYKFKNLGSVFYKRGKKINIISSGSVLKYIISSLPESKSFFINHISLPELNHFNEKVVLDKLINKNTLIVFDFYLASKKINSLINKIKIKFPYKKIEILDLNQNKEYRVGNNDFILEQFGINKENISQIIRQLI